MKPLVIGLGEVLRDLLPSGPRMGGAPANFACHARALGAEAAIISSVGAEDFGNRLRDKLPAMFHQLQPSYRMLGKRSPA